MPLRPIQEVVEQYVNAINYITTNSVPQARLFIEAGMELQVRRPEATTVAGNLIRFDSLDDAVSAAKNWLSINDTSSSNSSNVGAQYYDVSDVRGL